MYALAMLLLFLRNFKLCFRKSVSPIFINLIQSQMMRLDAAFLPCLSNISWTSLTIPLILEEIKSTLDKVDMFCKEVSTIQ